MGNSNSCVLVVTVVLAALSVAPIGFAQTEWFAAHLAGDREVGNPGDADGWGLGVVGIDDDTVWYHLWVTDISAPTAAHVHAGAAGVNGGVVVDFSPSFEEVSSGTYVATGSVSAAAGVVADLLENPAAFYVNVHNADHPAGAVRGQVLGDGPSTAALAGTLRGSRQVDSSGDPDGRGFGAVVFDDAMAHYFLAVSDIAPPTAAHIHRGDAASNGGVEVDFAPTFSDGVATGSVMIDEDLESEILASPDQFYFNVHNPDHPAGAVRGQLRATETVVAFAVISRAQGRVGSNWNTSLRMLSLSDDELMVYAEWYPSNDGGLETAAQTVMLGVAAGGTAVVDDAVSTLFAADGNGALRLLANEPFVAAARVFNDQRDNPEIGGTFGQFVPSSEATGMPAAGALLLPSNRPAGQGTGWRTNLGYFNPRPYSVSVTVSVWSVSGELLGSDSMVLEPFANSVRAVFDLVSSVSANQRTLDDFVVTYSAEEGVLLYLSVVDNATSDPIFVFPAPVPSVLRSAGGGQQENSPPSGSITSPPGNVTITEDESVNFAATASDPDGDDLGFMWDFGDGISSTQLSPGPHTYTESGTYTVMFTVMDEHGLADPTPDTRTITVEGGGGGNEATFSAVQSQIFTASCAFSGCHGGGSPAQGMSLVSGQAYANIVDVPSSEQPSLDRIEPSDPDSSYLYLKVIGDASISGGRMPLGQPPLSQELIDLLRDWIERGAPND
jgi:PKD repeat protein